MTRKIQILFLILLGSYPPLFLYSINQGELNISNLAVPLSLSVGIPIIVMIAWYLILRDLLRAAFVAAWLSVSFWTAGYLGNYVFFKNSNNGLSDGIITILLFVLLYLGGRTLIAVRANIDSRVISAAAALSGALILFSCVTILPTEVQRQMRGLSSGNKSSTAYKYVPMSTADKDAPNIIDIVLDGYARGDVLETRYNQSNKEFLDQLRKRGFHVLDKSTTNYTTTALSLTSILNMDYVTKPSGYLGNDMDHVTYMLQHNAAASFLRERGYRYITFQSGSTFTDGIVSDEFRSYTENMNQYQMQLMQFTPFNLLVYNWLRDSTNDPYVLHRRRVTNSLNGIAAVDDRKIPLYVFAHVICPHPPFIFHANGEPVRSGKRFNMWDADKYVSQGGDKDGYVKGYREQVTHLNKLVLKSVDRITSMMERPSIIVVHSDHGPGIGFDFNDMEASDLGERMSNLMAIRFPDGDYSSIYPTITGVNIYRTIFNKYFEADFPILPDNHYFAHWNKPFNQIPVSLEQIEKDNKEHF